MWPCGTDTLDSSLSIPITGAAAARWWPRGSSSRLPTVLYCTVLYCRFVITAAHCFYEEDEETKLITGKLEAGDVAVRIGDHNLVTFGETGLEQFVNVKKINIHDGYQQVIGEKAWKGSYDFAILELDTDVPIETYTPACIARATDGTTFDGKNLTMAGWGLLSDYPQEPHITTNVPYEVNVTVAENCQQNPRPTEMCVGLYTIGKGSCLVRLLLLKSFVFY